jgi:hypothetical protein
MRLSLSQDRSADLSSMHGWESIRREEVWGYRTYRHPQDEFREAAGTTEVTNDAEALTFFVGAGQTRGTLRLYSLNGESAQKMNDTHLLPPMNFKDGGWQTSISLTGKETSDQLFAVMSWFGFGSYV